MGTIHISKVVNQKIFQKGKKIESSSRTDNRTVAMIVTCRSLETCYYEQGTGLRGERPVAATSLRDLVSKSVNFTWLIEK